MNQVARELMSHNHKKTPARDLNFEQHTNHQAHDAPVVDALGSNKEPQLMTPGGAPLGQ